ncbi:hypothetical protein VDG1235_3663 [Verrucomicrobiia bacterium DG1235]|nr:hypothetical protein VDG1235_3663 [Verrucomicrobiae bacterium DG1235]
MSGRKFSVIPFEANRVWRSYLGGKLLDTLEGVKEAADGSFPEDWIGSVTAANNPDNRSPEEGLSRVRLESGESVLLADLISEDPEFYLGKSHVDRFGTDMRILVKYLDSAIRLHFQVHPRAEFSERHLGVSKGKTEAYVILSVRDDVKEPYIYAGFQRPPSREELKRWIEVQDIAAIEASFDKIPVKVGDVFLIPGGCPHALGEGILMVELMEASDLVVRFEYERGGFTLPEESRYMGKDLDFGLSVFDLEAKPASAFRCEPRELRRFDDGSTQRLLIGTDRTNCFVARSTCIEKSITKSENGFYIVLVTKGSGILRVGELTLALEPFSRALVAAGAGEVRIETEDGLELLELAGPRF